MGAMGSKKRTEAASELVRVAPHIGRFLRRTIEAETGSQSIIRHGVLKTLADQPCGNAELAAAMSVSNPTMSGLIEQLVRAGLVRREPDPVDRRAVRLTITEKGRAQLATTQAVLTRALTSVMHDLDDARLTALIEGLQGLDAALAKDRAKRGHHEKHKQREKAGIGS